MKFENKPMGEFMLFRMRRAVFPLRNEYSLDFCTTVWLLLLHQGKRRERRNKQ